MMLNVPVGQKRWHPYGPSDQSFDVNPTKRPSGMQGAAGFNLSPMGGYEMSPMMANMPGLGMVSRGRGIRVPGGLGVQEHARPGYGEQGPSGDSGRGFRK